METRPADPKHDDVARGRMYQLIRQHEAVRERSLEITFLGRDAAAYSFTFG